MESVDGTKLCDVDFERGETIAQARCHECMREGDPITAREFRLLPESEVFIECALGQPKSALQLASVFFRRQEGTQFLPYEKKNFARVSPYAKKKKGLLNFNCVLQTPESHESWMPIILRRHWAWKASMARNCVTSILSVVRP